MSSARSLLVERDRVATGGALESLATKLTNNSKKIRRALDFIAVVLHAVFIYLACRKGPEMLSNNTEVLLLVAMSAITIFFHGVYWRGIRDLNWPISLCGRDLFTIGLEERNTLKWFEYSITATLGTLSLAYTSSGHNEASGPVLFFLAAVAVTEQTTGYLWDSIGSFKKKDSSNLRWPAYRAYFTTFLCQGAEFAVLFSIVHTHETPDDPTSPIVIPGSWYAYTITWSLFGIWAGLRPLNVNVGKWEIRGLDWLDDKGGIQVSEIGYSILSTTAKISLFGTILQEEGFFTNSN
jgi:hypothetical protein